MKRKKKREREKFGALSSNELSIIVTSIWMKAEARRQSLRNDEMEISFALISIDWLQFGRKKSTD